MAVQGIDLHEALHKYFGFNQFKGNQEVIIQSLLGGNHTFVIMPTGGGKSLCYQLPALMMRGTAIVISPLIALMKNQVDSIRGYSQEDNVAHFLNSSLNKGQIKQVKQDITDGKTKLLYVAPETLTKDENIEFFQSVDVSFIAVDEAHCISEWGHDFRPEYRRIRTMIDCIKKDIPVIALTATATPKVKSDILKNLNMSNEHAYVLSFNRDNLFYEIRPKGKKDQTIKNILQFIKGKDRNSGIIYVQNRKTAEDIAQVLNVNGIKAAPYHAGLDAKTRANTQDDFLMEEIDVICATIAFGMGIDKPDVRFVIHYNIPKSIENYYQETGRAGRDGLEGVCISYYAHSDIVNLEKFLRDKPVAEREMGAQLLQEVAAYAETSSCRRKFLLHYFGEDFDDKNCNNMCDNCKYPKDKISVVEEMQIAMEVVQSLNENYDMKMLVDFIMGKKSQQMKDFGFDQMELFGAGEDKEQNFWQTIYHQALLHDLVYKDIEKYGLLKLTDAGRKFITNPTKIEITINHAYTDEADPEEEGSGKTAALDETLMRLLQDLRKSEAKKHQIPPYAIFQDPSLEEMASQYPVTMEDLSQISGVSMGKAQKFGKPFITLINKYVEENEIERPSEFIVKSVVNKSRVKIAIIHGIDKKLPLEDLAFQNNLTMDELFHELDFIVTSGTKVNLDYIINDSIDEYTRDEIYDYFMEAESDSLNAAYKDLKDGDIRLEEIQLMRIKFLSEVAN